MSNRYSRTQLLETISVDGGDDYLSFLSGRYNRFLVLLKSKKQIVVTSTNEMRLEAISFREYGTIHLWWVIGVYNGVINPFREVVAGSKLRIPTLESINEYFDTVKRDQLNGASRVVVLS